MGPKKADDFMYRSLQPLVMSLLDPDGVQTLRANREKLSHDITDLINEYGPKVFPDFDGMLSRGMNGE